MREAQFRHAARELAEHEHDPDLAKLTVSSRQWERWSAGNVKTEPHPDACRVLEHMFGYPVQQLLASQDIDNHEPQEEDQEEMERRRLLQSLAALGVAFSPLTQELETVRASLSSVFGHDDRNHLDDWEETLAEYGHAYLATSPLTLIPDLAADIAAVRSIVHRLAKSNAEYRGWCRIGGALSGLMAKSLSNLGHARDSRQWWNTAQHVADASGDLDLSLWVRGERINHGLYENRPAQMLLRQIDTAIELARGHTCAGLVKLSTNRAQVVVLSGDHRSADEDLNRAWDTLGRLPSTVTKDTGSVFGWAEDRLHYAETWVYAYMGNVDKADQAAGRALQLYPAADVRSPVQINLMQALAGIRCGDISEGIRHAREIYGPLRSDQRTMMVETLAQQVLSSIPAEARNRSGVVAFRELTASSSQKAIWP